MVEGSEDHMPNGLVACILVACVTVSCGSDPVLGRPSPHDAGPDVGMAPPSDTQTLTMDNFAVPPQGEFYKCQNFPNPFGMDTGIVELDSNITVGSHHLLVFMLDQFANQPGPLEDCSGLDFPGVPIFASQVAQDSMVYPPGVAITLKAASTLRFQAHYLNAGANYLPVTVSLKLRRAAPGTIQNQAGVFLTGVNNIYVPPMATGKATFNCNVPYPMNIVAAMGHMHSHGTDIAVTMANRPVFDQPTWSNVTPLAFAPPFASQAGDKLSYTCTYTNTTGIPLTFGESAKTDEMCVFVAMFYPVPSAGGSATGYSCAATP
jgi:hypothetical protein